ncbi:hypothetical protein [Streptomyces millisiae]|uniref:Uncharacterized protein n=1 Tax=Streptomyces millisiae TaxID=3075542 RepID=A0ABU2LV11_9ACTN|nr:hypothetical protein [Streptomyces sp. DSM 44918]MDT0321424.1 hypothetical protein [Streptomyces sp. DSM 44918]
MTTELPPAWGALYVLCLPTQDAARAAASDLAGRGHRLTAVRSIGELHVHAEPALAGWWQVLSLAVITGYHRAALEPVLRAERIGVAGVARSLGGFAQGGTEGYAATLELAFVREGLAQEAPGAELPVPDPLPVDPPRPAAAPPWPGLDLGEPAAVVGAVVDVAQRMHGDDPEPPGPVAWLLSEKFAVADPYQHTGALLGDLADAVAHQGTCTPDTADTVPFLAELALDDGIPAGSRAILLGDLLRLATGSAAAAVAMADQIAALGGVWREPAAASRTRQAITRVLPRLLATWERQPPALRLALAALAAACDGQEPVPVLGALPAPEGTDRADAVALIQALVANDGVGSALARLAWLPSVVERAASPHAAARLVALAILPEIVMDDIGQAVTGL